MSFTTLSIRHDVAKRLKAAKLDGESFSDLLERLLENQPAVTVGEWLESLKPLEGHGVFTPETRERLREKQRSSRPARRKRNAAA